MKEQFFNRLASVKSRQQWMMVLKTSSIGLLISGVIAFQVALRLRQIDHPNAVSTPLLILLAGVLIGFAVGMIRRVSWQSTATAIDGHYGLKDRVLSALQFLTGEKKSAVHQLQEADAISHLDGISAKEVVPIRVPKTLPVALFVALLSGAIMLAPVGRSSVDASPSEPLAHIQNEAEKIEEEIIDQLEELAEHPEGQELRELVSEMKELLQEMKEPGVDERQAIAKISEMQAAIAAMQSEYNLEAMDANMEAIGEAMTATASLQKAGEELKNQNYDAAAKQLENFDPKDLTNRESQSLQKSLAKLSKKLDAESGKQGKLSQSLSKMCEGMKEGNKKECKNGACKLAGLCKKQGLRKKIGNCLGCQLGMLSQCKGACSGKGGGMGMNISKSNRPTDKWGMGASGKPLGDEATQLDGARKREELTGTAGEGPSEKEVSHSPEGRQMATRSYKESYKKFKKMSENVLDSEPLPLGHRQTIRTYFEGIRPQNGDLGDVLIESDKK